MGLRVGFVGCGGFASSFIPLFKLHPRVEKVVLCDRKPERLAEKAKQFGVAEAYTDMDDMLRRSNVDCVAVFVPRHLHGPVVTQALKAGKHVYCAVPTGNSVEEIHEIVDLVRSTRLIYMIGETCYYFPCAMFCRNTFRSGRLGEFVYGEAQYHHDISEFYSYYQREEGDDWRRVAGLPPNHVWAAARYMLPGLIGHQSALRDGEPMNVPDFGDPPADWTLLNPDGE